MKKYVAKIFFILILIVAVGPVSAAILQGNNKEYAGEKINFYRYTDPVTLGKELAFTIQFNADGSFKTDVALSEPASFFSEFGIYRGMLVVNPGDETELLFPPLREKSFADEKNPYFEPISFWFATQRGDKITDRISAFEKDFNKLTDRYFNYLYFRKSEEMFDSLKTTLNQKYPAKESEVLDMHKTLKLEALKADAFRLNTPQVSAVLDNVKSQYWTFPAFVTFFQKEFANKLSFEAKAVHGSNISQAVAQRNASYLLGFVQEQYHVHGDMAKLALLKMLHDGYYSKEFSQEAILAILQSGKFRSEGNKPIKTIARNVAEKLVFLRPGTKAPVICLKNINGLRVCTDEFPDKYKYLIFADTEMIVCREHLKYLAEIQQKFQEQLQIIIVLRKTDLIEMKIFLDKQQIPGVKLVDQDGEYIEKYRIQSFPVAFLLDKNHEVVFEHTKNPLDGFEQQFALFLRNKRIEDLRNQSR